MPATDTQIKIAYEQENMTPEQIATDQGFELIAVKAKLMQVSSKYRKACGAEDEELDELNFDKDQMKVVTRELFNLAMGAESEKVRADLLKYIRDDKKGRKDVVRGIAGNTFNILSFNQAIQQAREGAEKIKRGFIDVGESKAA